MTVRLNKIDLERTYTLEEFMVLPDPEEGGQYELIEGKLYLSPSPGDAHGRIGNLLAYFLTDFVMKNKLGAVWSNSTFRFGPQTGLAPDIAFIAAGRVPKSSYRLAIEIQSPGDSSTYVKNKVKIYQTTGVRLVWVIQPKLKIAAVFRPDQESYLTVQPEGWLDGENVLPGFRLPLQDIFELD